jgi:hypothetical protein
VRIRDSPNPTHASFPDRVRGWADRIRQARSDARMGLILIHGKLKDCPPILNRDKQGNFSGTGIINEMDSEDFIFSLPCARNQDRALLPGFTHKLRVSLNG